MVPVLKQVRQALANLNPNDVRATADRPVSIRLAASSDDGFRAIERFLLPADLTPARRHEQLLEFHRTAPHPPGAAYDIEIFEAGLNRPATAFTFYPEAPERLVRDILETREELGLPLARRFPPFREAVTGQVIQRVGKENALFSVATALPNIAPSLLELPWALGEFGSDTVFLTVNQVRMLFLLAGASDRHLGYRQQRAEIASVIAGAFGWRALARELAGKVPFGGGLIPKAAIAFAGTYVIGRSAERLYRIGYGYTREERRQAYGEAFERGKKLAATVLENLKERRQLRNQAGG
ncbi:MAG: hypothetical protein KIT09_05860 [Bryobacteraceae bacterium]|nr:hypothetical protein [Bryobacteraceae bacterium]